MKRFFLNNWQAKLMSLVVGFAIWYLIKKNIDTTESHWSTGRHSRQIDEMQHPAQTKEKGRQI